MTQTNNQQERKTGSGRRWHRTLDAVGWGLFFIWIGIAILLDVGWGIGLIGVGVLIIGLRAAGAYTSGSACSGISKARS